MTRKSGVVIFIVPGLQTQAWLEALKAAAAQRGLTYEEDWGGEQRPDRADVSVIWTEASCGEGVTVVIAPDTDDAIQGCSEFYSVPRDEGMRIASRRYSLANVLVTEGAVLLRPGGVVDIPGLGEIELARTITPETDGRILGIFETLPIPVGASSAWPAGLMWEPGETVRAVSDQYMDLTGRRRLLAFGPFIMLPSGCWRVTVVIDVNIEISPAILNIQWGDELVESSDDFTVSESGRYQIVLETKLDKPAVPQLKIFLQRATFSGYLKLVSVECLLVQKVNS